MKDSKGQILKVDDTIEIPNPIEGDTWTVGGFTTLVDDILDNGTVIFMDEFFDSHEINISRVTKI